MIGPEPEPTGLSGMTKAELLSYAADSGIQGVNKDMRKADILAAIEGVTADA